MDNNKKEKLLKLVYEIGEKGIKRYVKAYSQIKGKNSNVEDFANNFYNYIKHCKNKSKDGIGRISILGFKFFLNGMDLKEVMRNIEEVNNKNDDNF